MSGRRTAAVQSFPSAAQAARIHRLEDREAPTACPGHKLLRQRAATSFCSAIGRKRTRITGFRAEDFLKDRRIAQPRKDRGDATARLAQLRRDARDEDGRLVHKPYPRTS